jgi:hypothetical protein
MEILHLIWETYAIMRCHTATIRINSTLMTTVFPLTTYCLENFALAIPNANQIIVMCAIIPAMESSPTMHAHPILIVILDYFVHLIIHASYGKSLANHAGLMEMNAQAI